MQTLLCAVTNAMNILSSAGQTDAIVAAVHEMCSRSHDAKTNDSFLRLLVLHPALMQRVRPQRTNVRAQCSEKQRWTLHHQPILSHSSGVLGHCLACEQNANPVHVAPYASLCCPGPQTLTSLIGANINRFHTCAF